MVAVFGAVWEPKKVDTLIIGRGTRKNDPQKKKEKVLLSLSTNPFFFLPRCVDWPGGEGRLGN